MRDYVSFSTWNRYQECEAQALARDRGEVEFQVTDAMIVSKYVEAKLIGTEEDVAELYEEHPEIINSRTGKPKVAYRRAEAAVEQAKDDSTFMGLLKGNKQVKLEGEIDGVKVMGYADNINDGRFISDLKAMANINRVWDDEKRMRVSFVQAYNYAVQGYIYKELYKQSTGYDVDFYLVVMTKTDPSKRVIVAFDEDTMGDAEQLFRKSLSNILKLRAEEKAPVFCGQCDYCTANQPTLVMDSETVGMTNHELEEYEEYKYRGGR